MVLFEVVGEVGGASEVGAEAWHASSNNGAAARPVAAKRTKPRRLTPCAIELCLAAAYGGVKLWMLDKRSSQVGGRF